LRLWARSHIQGVTLASTTTERLRMMTPEEKAASARACYAAHREVILAQKRARYAANREKILARRRARNAEKKQKSS